MLRSTVPAKREGGVVPVAKREGCLLERAAHVRQGRDDMECWPPHEAKQVVVKMRPSGSDAASCSCRMYGA